MQTALILKLLLGPSFASSKTIRAFAADQLLMMKIIAEGNNRQDFHIGFEKNVTILKKS